MCVMTEAYFSSDTNQIYSNCPMSSLYFFSYNVEEPIHALKTRFFVSIYANYEYICKQYTMFVERKPVLDYKRWIRYKKQESVGITCTRMKTKEKNYNNITLMTKNNGTEYIFYVNQNARFDSRGLYTTIDAFCHQIDPNF